MHVCHLAARFCPRFAFRCPSKRGSRECRMRAAPAVSRAKQVTKTHTSIQGSGGDPTFPAQWLYGLYVVSPAIGLVCHRRQRIWLASPGWAWKTSADLTPASRRQNHTTSPYAAASFVSALLIAHGSWLNPQPALQFTCAPNAAASTASHPNVRDDGQRPFLRDRMAGVLKVICPTAKAKICPSGCFAAATAQWNG
jgi:hypothetical protein